MIYLILAILFATVTFYFMYRKGQERMKTNRHVDETDIVFAAIGTAFIVGILWPAMGPIFAVYIYLSRNNK